MSDMPLARLPEYQRYDCQACGYCCKGVFTIVLTQEECARLAAQGWEKEPEFKGVKLFVPYAGERMRLNHRKGGDCVFLDENIRCRIHAKFGPEAKPLACQAYPYKCIPTGIDYKVDLRFDCPAVAENHGRPLAEQQTEITALLPQLARRDPALYCAPADVPHPLFTAEHTIPWSHAARITELFLRLLEYDAVDLTTRVAGCVDAIALLRTLDIKQLTEEQLATLVDAITQKAVNAMEAAPIERSAPPPLVLTAFRQHLSLYAREDRWGAKSSLLQRLRIYFGMLGGNGFVPHLCADFPHVPFYILEDPLGMPPDAVVEPVLRCLRFRLESLGFFGPAFYHYPYLDGLSALLLTYPMIFWFARAYAIGGKLPAPDAACIARGVQHANRAYGISPVPNIPVERARLASLCKRPTLRKLITWYGR